MASPVPVKRDPAGNVLVLDQSRLPAEETWKSCSSAEQVADAIRRNSVVGSSAIGITAAFGLALGAQKLQDEATFEEEWGHMCANMVATRPSAPDLFRCIEQMKKAASSHRGTHGKLLERLSQRADELRDARGVLDKKLAETGEALIEDGWRVLLHGSSGAMATGGYGTALGIIKAAVENGKHVKITIAEARPDLQGARVGAWEAAKCKLSTKICVDGAVGHLVQRKAVDAVIVEAQRVAANGDTAGNIGTYMMAAVCQHHNIPFYVVAPLNVIDVSVPTSKYFMDEKKNASVMKEVGASRGKPGVTVVPAGVALENPAFDRTPAELIAAIITEVGVVTKDDSQSFIAGLREQLQSVSAA